MINTEGLGNIPAKDIVEKMGISHQDDPKLEEATKEIYSKEFYEGILANNTKQFVGIKIPVATLRPETLFGVTNIWINPQVMYQKIKVNDEIWITSPECARKLEFLEKKIEVIEDVLGSDFVGQSAKAPHSSDSVLILPASFVKSDNGTGIVMSVPAHAPFDYQALLDSKSGKNKSINSDLLKNIQNIEPILSLIHI